MNADDGFQDSPQTLAEETTAAQREQLVALHGFASRCLDTIFEINEIPTMFAVARNSAEHALATIESDPGTSATATQRAAMLLEKAFEQLNDIAARLNKANDSPSLLVVP